MNTIRFIILAFLTISFASRARALADAPTVPNSAPAHDAAQDGAGKKTVTLSPLGDSRTAIVSYDGVPFLQLSSQSHLNWANALNEQKYPCTGNFGISGAVTDKTLADMLAPALATHATYMPILMGVNDVKIPGFDARHTMSNIAKAADAALAQGTIPILFTDPGAELYNPAQVAFINDLNERIKAYCTANPKAVLFDMAELMSTQRTPTIIFHPGWSYDGIHLQTLGAYKIGRAFAALMDQFQIDAPEYPGSSGNLLKNAGFTGTAGKPGAGNKGSLPDSFDGTHDKASTSADFSINKRSDGTVEIVAIVTNTDPKTLAGVRISQTIPLTGINPGEGIQAGVQVDVDQGSVNLGDVRAEVNFVFEDGSFSTTYDFETSMAREGKPARDTISSIPDLPVLKLTLQTSKITCPQGKMLKGVTFRMGSRIAGQGHATVRFRNPWCKK